MQNILYLVVCFFLMRPYINACITKKIILYGSVVIGLGICMVLLISISRFTSIEAEGSNISKYFLYCYLLLLYL